MEHGNEDLDGANWDNELVHYAETRQQYVCSEYLDFQNVKSISSHVRI